MPANYTRRRDLFADAGLADPERLIRAVVDEVKALGLPAEWPAMASPEELAQIRRRIAPRLERVPPEQRRLASVVPEWVRERSGDLAAALWLAHAQLAPLDVPGFLLAVLDAFLASGRVRDAFGYARFMLDLRFEWGRVYADPSLAYEFLKPREPNPLVWRLLEELSACGVRLRVLELGCGVGNDAFAFLSSPLVDAYVGVDVSAQALAAFQARADREGPRVRPTLVQGDFLDLLGRLPDPARTANLVYSYSSLHYFSSGELGQIYALVRSLLMARRPEPGFFAFGIKGHGSIWDGQGIPIYRPDVWINWDGNSRWFPNRQALQRQLDQAGFEIRFHELHDHWGYSEHGKRDVFHYVLCSPRLS